MVYKENLVEAYAKLDAVVGIWIDECGGKVDDRPQLKAELAARLKKLDEPPEEAQVGGVKVWSNGTWYAPEFHKIVDDRGYMHVVQNTVGAPTNNYYGAFHHWMRNEFLVPEIATPRLCGEKRDLVHHINENKQDNNVANLVYIPSGLHRIFHPTNTAMPASTPALIFIQRYGDRRLTTTTNAELSVIDARWLYSELGVGTRFNDWITQWSAKVGFTVGTVKPPSTVGGRPSQEYTLTGRDALKIAMATDTPTAEAVRESLIDKLLSAQKLATALSAPLTRTDALQRERVEHPDLMAAIDACFNKQNAEITSLRAQLATWQDLVGDGGYVSKRAVKHLRKEVANV